MRALLTGGNGMLGRNIADQWRATRPDDELLVVTRAEIDLRDAAATLSLIADLRPTLVIHTAAKVGGIMSKIADPTAYLLDNLLLDTSVIRASLSSGAHDLLYIGSAAMYPERYHRPLVESDLMTGSLEPVNEGYALAKIAASTLCGYASAQFGVNYRVAVPSNLYGPHDDYSPDRAHLVAAALAKTHAAHLADDPSVTIWGDGSARREFLYVEDLAGWLVGQADRLSGWPALVNLGTGVDHSVAEYYEVARRVVGYRGDFFFDTTKPAGTHQRLLDSSPASALGWAPSTSLESGMAEAYRRMSASPRTRKA